MNLEKERLFRRDGFGKNYASATPLVFSERNNFFLSI